MAKVNANEVEISGRKKCFIITPLGEEKSETRRKADGVINAVLSPVLDSLDIEMVKPHGISNPGSITQQVIQYILNSELVIANLTELNPNVMYELAVRHAKGAPVICIAENSTKLPFDISSERTIFYNNDMFGVEILKSELKKMVECALKDRTQDNPIYRADRDFKLREAVIKKDGDSDLSYLFNKLDMLENKINLLNMKSDAGAVNSSKSMIEYYDRFLKELADKKESQILIHSILERYKDQAKKEQQEKNQQKLNG